MKHLPKILVFGLLILSCTAINQTGALQIPADAKAVEFIKKAEMAKKGAPLSIKYAEQNGDYAVFSVSYSGGCEEHVFNLVSTGAFATTYPPEVEVLLAHNNNGDMCRSVVDEKLFFDLTPLRYDGTNQVRLIVKNTNKTLDYNY